eukprot:15442581-Alexandrium_andersonii.AAC.1
MPTLACGPNGTLRHAWQYKFAEAIQQRRFLHVQDNGITVSYVHGCSCTVFARGNRDNGRRATETCSDPLPILQISF